MYVAMAADYLFMDFYGFSSHAAPCHCYQIQFNPTQTAISGLLGAMVWHIKIP